MVPGSLSRWIRCDGPGELKGGGHTGAWSSGAGGDGSLLAVWVVGQSAGWDRLPCSSSRRPNLQVQPSAGSLESLLPFPW